VTRLRPTKLRDEKSSSGIHRVGAAPALDGDEGGQHQPAHDDAGDRGCRPALRAGAERQPPRQCREPDRGQQCTGAVERADLAAGQVLDIARAEVERTDGDRHVDEEHRAPADGVDEPAADQRPDRTGRGAGRRPDADRLAAGLAGEAAAEDGQARRHEHRRAHALQHAAAEQPGQRGREGAEQRGGEEEADTAQQQPAVAVAVAGSAAHQEQRAERQQVAADDPRQGDGVIRERAPDRRQTDVDDRAVNERQARCEHRRRQDQPRMGGAGAGGGRRRLGDAAVAGGQGRAHRSCSTASVG